MTGALVLRPLLDAAAPEDPAAAARRVRLAAIWLALAAWLLPQHPSLGTDTIAHRAILCGTFAAAAVCAHFRTRHRWARVGLAVAACAAAALVAWFGRGALWGLGFVVYGVIVLGATDARRRFVRIEALPDEPDPLPPRPRHASRFLAWYAWFVISVLFMVSFVGQAMVVPTGSMQPTIMGAQGRGASGDHLFVDQFSYLFRDPRRWEIVVFEYPLFRERNFVKRLVGLPGEHVEFKDGDVWVNGRIATKPPLVQATLWREEFPRAGPSGARKEIQQGWLQERSGDGGDWKKLGPSEVRGKGGETWLFCTRKIEGGDVRLSFEVSVEAGAWANAKIVSHGTPVEVRLPTTDSTFSEFTVGDMKTTEKWDPLSPGSSWHRVELTVLDGETWWSVDGEQQERREMPAARGGETRVSIGVSGQSEATFRNLRVERDIVYERGGGPGAYDVPADSFFFLGDNVPQSEDSRKWAVSEFRTASGAVFRAAPDVIDEQGVPARNIAESASGWTFADVDGVRRVVPREGTKRTNAIPAPFATRSHLIGRAVLVFWPWLPADAGFRPRLLP